MSKLKALSQAYIDGEISQDEYISLVGHVMDDMSSDHLFAFATYLAACGEK